MKISQTPHAVSVGGVKCWLGYEFVVTMKLTKPENMWNFIKLDTRTGRLSQVQFSTQGYEYRFQTVLSDVDLSYEEHTKPNRFELYPTQNTYNFILLDKVDGRVWQVQWSFEEEERMVLRIY